MFETIVVVVKFREKSKEILIIFEKKFEKQREETVEARRGDEK